MWLRESADRFGESLSKGDMHAMCTELGSITGFATSVTSASKVCRVNGSERVPTQSHKEDKVAFREHFSKITCATVMFSTRIRAMKHGSKSWCSMGSGRGTLIIL